MRLVAINELATLVCPPGNYDFVHLCNVSGQVLRIKYDGDPDLTAGLTLPGWFAKARIMRQGEMIFLDNDGDRNLFVQGIYAMHGFVGQQHNILVIGG